MSIRTRVEDAMILYAIGRPEAALLCALVAISATAKRRRPRGTPSVQHPGKQMRDREAFEAFVKEEMPRICRVVNCNVQYRGQLHALEHIFYKWLRCELAHDAALPQDIAFEPDPSPGTTRLQVRPDGVLVLSYGWLDGLADAVIHAPENADQFGSPPKPPIPIPLPRIGLTIGHVNPPEGKSL